MQAKYVIIGAGPTGLGAAHRLKELGCDSFLLLEKNSHAGGLAASFKDGAGFTWDIGGHVVFSHYEYFDRLLDGLLGRDFLSHQRESWIRACGVWTPYPFQNNVRHLPREHRWECVRGLLPGVRPEHPPVNFREWIECVFGRGIAEVFLRPYNEKVWAAPLESMSYAWIGERVSVIDLERVLKNILLERDDVSFGPNSTFRFPLFGGTGQIFRKLAERVDDRILYGQDVARIDARIDARKKTVLTKQGLTVGFERLLNTGPLDLLVSRWMDSPPEACVEAAGRLAHNGVSVSGIGVGSYRPDPKCWMYFPEPAQPFYRATNFHNYSPNNAAIPGAQRALMCETAFSQQRPEDLSTLVERSIDGLVSATLLTPDDSRDVVSRWQHTVEYGYPIPTLERDSALKTIQPWLESLGLFSRGRFGGWKYEVGNMDHSVMQGVEWAERMVTGAQEKTYSWK